jgi:hypothetical protein
VRDPRYDLGRIQRQQDFIRRALDRAVSKGARNPGTLDRLLDAGLASVTIDDELTTGDIFDLAQRFREFDPDSLETYTVPVVREFKGAADVVLLVENEAEPILSRFRGDATDGALGEDDGEGTGSESGDGDDATTGASADMVPASVRLTVLNGSGANGQAMLAADQLTEAGFIVVGRGEEPGFGIDRTVVRYPEGSRAAAELVSRWLEGGADLEEIPAGSAGAGQGVVVVTGTDWAGLAAEPAPPMPPQEGEGEGDDPGAGDGDGSGDGGEGDGAGAAGDDTGGGVGGVGGEDGIVSEGETLTTVYDPRNPMGTTTSTDGTGTGPGEGTTTTSTTVPPDC